MNSYGYLVRYLGGLIFVACISGCNNSNNPFSSSSSSASSVVATGVWTGTDLTSGDNIAGIINSAGEADFIRSDGVQFVGTMQISGSTLAGTLDGYSNFGAATLADGSTSGIGTFNGSVTTASSIVGNFAFTSIANTSYPGSWSMTYYALSTTGSSLSAISGSYTDQSSAENSNTGGTVTINTSGIISSLSATSGCVMNGSIGVGDSSTDIYEISYTYTSCTGQWASLNAVPFAGLAVLNTTQSPAQLVVGVTGQNSSGTKYGLYNVFSMN